MFLTANLHDIWGLRVDNNTVSDVGYDALPAVKKSTIDRSQYNAVLCLAITDSNNLTLHRTMHATS